MARVEGGNLNRNPDAIVTIYTINSSTATEIAVLNEGRFYFSVDLEPGLGNIAAFIRLYAAATDNIAKGIVLRQVTAGNDSLFRPAWEMSELNIYTGPISAISDAGTFDLYVTEY